MIYREERLVRPLVRRRVAVETVGAEVLPQVGDEQVRSLTDRRL